jgi:hypothetical protein
LKLLTQNSASNINADDEWPAVTAPASVTRLATVLPSHSQSRLSDLPSLPHLSSSDTCTTAVSAADPVACGSKDIDTEFTDDDYQEQDDDDESSHNETDNNSDGTDSYVAGGDMEEDDD